MYEKSIAYDRETRDYAMYLDGKLVGFARTYHEAEVTLDQLVFELMTDGHFATATELDGGAFCATCGNDGDCPDCAPQLDPILSSPKHRLAINRLSIHFAATLHIPCKLCAGDHMTQHCPSIRAMLFADPVMMAVMVMDVEFAPVGWSA